MAKIGRYGPGETASELVPGDFILTAFTDWRPGSSARLRGGASKGSKLSALD